MKTGLPPDMPTILPASIRLIGSCFFICMQTACQTIYPLISPITLEKPVQKIPDYPTVERGMPGCSAIERKYHCDRRVILSMPGNYQVNFSITETIGYQHGYARNAPWSGARFETVILIEDTGSKISLQHILQTENGTPIKHRRQDWIHESTGHWHYTGAQRFELRQRNHEDVPGSWTQLVYEADEAPHYSSSGYWSYDNGTVSWISQASLRPVSRWEPTLHPGNQLISTMHRYTITPQGWVHEEDNLKLIRPENDPSGVRDLPLVRTSGFTEYRRIVGLNFSPAQTYWLETASFWQATRTRWQKAFHDGGVIQLMLSADDSRLINSITALADIQRKNPQHTIFESRLDQLFRRFVRTEQLVFFK